MLSESFRAPGKLEDNDILQLLSSCLTCNDSWYITLCYLFEAPMVFWIICSLKGCIITLNGNQGCPMVSNSCSQDFSATFHSHVSDWKARSYPVIGTSNQFVLCRARIEKMCFWLWVDPSQLPKDPERLKLKVEAVPTQKEHESEPETYEWILVQTSCLRWVKRPLRNTEIPSQAGSEQIDQTETSGRNLRCDATWSCSLWCFKPESGSNTYCWMLENVVFLKAFSCLCVVASNKFRFSLVLNQLICWTHEVCTANLEFPQDKDLNDWQWSCRALFKQSL